MRLVDLSSHCSVNPEYVASVTLVPAGYPNMGQAHVAVHMQDGTIHQIEIGYGETAYATHKKVLTALADKPTEEEL